MNETARHREFEERLVNQLEARAQALTGKQLPADEVSSEAVPEGVDALRSQLQRLGVFDRAMLDRLAGSRSRQLVFRRRRLGGLLRQVVARVRVRTLVPVGDLLADREASPAGREDVLDALAVYEVLPRRQRPSLVVLASARGFTPEARELVKRRSELPLVLIGGRADGGWDVDLPDQLARGPWQALFELESADERLRRLLRHLEDNAATLDTRGLDVDELAAQMGLDVEQTRRLVRQACRNDPRLMTVVLDGRTCICRVPFAESDTMSIWSRIRRWLGFKPTTAQRVRELTAQRVQIEQQRHEVDQKIAALEEQERELLHQGAAAASDAERKQVAGKLMRLRRELRRQRSQAQLFTQQIDIIGTHIHHLTLAQQGQRLELPTAEDLTREAAQAEQVVSELAANADLAASIEVSSETPLMQEEEAAIFEEFKQMAASPPAAEQPPAAAQPRAAGEAPEPAPQAEAPAPPGQAASSDPEAGAEA